MKKKVSKLTFYKMERLLTNLNNEYEVVAERLFKEGLVKPLENKRVLVTGASGLIGTQIGKGLILCNKKYGTHVNVLLHDIFEDKLVERYGEDLKREEVEVMVSDIREGFSYEKDVDYIIHCASNTSSKFFVTNPVETISILMEGTKNTLEFAKEKNVKGFVYLSSLEIYGDVFDEKEKISEDSYHFLDFLNIRSSYPEGKRMCECLCSAYASEYNLPIFIARLAQTIGADVNPNDNRAFAEFARCAVLGNNIVLKSKGGTIRNYCDIADTTVALFYILTKGEKGNAYNVANRSTLCSIKELAELYCKLSKHDIHLEFDLSKNPEELGYQHEIKVNLDPSKIEALGWRPVYSLKNTVQKLIDKFEEKMK